MFNLVPWKRPRTSDLTEFRKEMDTLFDRFFGSDFFPTREFFREGRWLPMVDVSEGEKLITVKAEIPGMDAKDIDISLDGRVLSIKGEKKQESEEKKENFYRSERSYGYFNRSVELPADVDPNEVDASYKKGILTIKMHKTEESERKKINVKSG